MRIVVVGGVAGGMSCAARARRLDERAEIIVLERGPHVSFANCGLPYFVGGEIADQDSLLVQTPERLAASLNLDVRTHHDAVGLDADRREVIVRTPLGEERIGYDELVLSPGARPRDPRIPGLAESGVRHLRTVDDARALRDAREAGIHHALVLGGGFIGVEAAESLARSGVDVTVIHSGAHVLNGLEDELAGLVETELTHVGVTVRTQTVVERIEDGSRVVLTDGTVVNADIIISATGVHPDTAVFEAAGVQCRSGAIVVDDRGRTSLPHIWAVGDATASARAVTGVTSVVALAGPANRAGRLVADQILRPENARPIPAPLGTAIIRVGQLTAAMTGANRRDLEACSHPFRTVHLHPNQHAGYFPGAAPIHLVVHFAEVSGELLGAQAVGVNGVDKRIDVLATAIRAGMRIDDLIDLDLAYAPPYGSAKDPINFVGMLGANVLDGTLRTWDARHLDTVLESSLILDVRTDTEVSHGIVDGALHIPHTELRARLDDVRAAAAGRPVRVMCASGVRSAIAHRVLTQNGFDSASLSGGMLTLTAWLGERADRYIRVPALRA